MWTRVRRWAYAAAVLAALAIVPASFWGGPHLLAILVGVALSSLTVAVMGSFRAVTRTVKEIGTRSQAAIERMEGHRQDRFGADLRKWRQEVGTTMELIQDVPFVVQDLRHDVEQLARELTSVEERRGEYADHLSKQVDHLKARAEQTYKRTFTIAAALEELPSGVAEMRRIDGALRTANRPVPQLGGWAATVSTISLLTDRIVSDEGIRHVVECGSGSSTVWAALALKTAARRGHVFSIEHEQQFVRSTTDLLIAHGVDAYATVLHAPLREQEVGDRSLVWYDRGTFQDLLPSTIDLLFVDGPPQATGEMARFPAFPILAGRMRRGSLVIVDDADRDDEAEMIDEWCTNAGGDVRLNFVTRAGRAVVLEVGKSL